MDMNVSYGVRDICRAILVPTTCEGVADPTNPPFTYCSATKLTIEEQFEAGSTITDESGQSGENCHEYEQPPKRTGWKNTIEVCSTEQARFWALMGWAVQIEDPNEPGKYIGWEPTALDAASCVSCSVTGALCKHKMAMITIHNAWCGKERHPDIAFVALIQRCLVFEPNGIQIVRGRGFNGRQYVATLKSNPQFADPWGIDPRGAGVIAPFSEICIGYDQIAALAELGVLACQCPTCKPASAPTGEPVDPFAGERVLANA